MKIRSIVVASAALAVAPFAMAQEAPAGGGTDCASLQAQYDQAAASATAEAVSAAKAARDEGDKLCAEGKTEEGAAKLQEAISALQGGSASQSMPEQAPTEEPAAPEEQAPPQG
jgi:hypothetical protein